MSREGTVITWLARVAVLVIALGNALNARIAITRVAGAQPVPEDKLTVRFLAFPLAVAGDHRPGHGIERLVQRRALEAELLELGDGPWKQAASLGGQTPWK